MPDKKNSKGATKPSIKGDPDSFKDQSPLVLLSPKFDKAKSLQKALLSRKTTQEITDKKLSLQSLSNLLWSACGVNRKKGPFGIRGRTAATASNSQEIDLYVAMEEGVWLYDAYNHRLIPVVAGD